MKVPLVELAELLRGELIGDGKVLISGVCDIRFCKPDHIAYLGDKRYLKYLNREPAAVFTNIKIDDIKIPKIIVDDPKAALVKLIRFFQGETTHQSGIDKTAHIAPDVILGGGIYVGANVVIESGARIEDRSTLLANVYVGKNVKIGSDGIIYPNVTIYDGVIIKNHVVIHAGVVIGADGFGYIEKNNVLEKIPQIGGVIIEDYVEIGANTTIDRATLGYTIIGYGTKLDNLVHIGHNVQIGKYCRIAAQVGISGSVKIGDNVVIGGQAGVAEHVVIGDGVKIAAKAGVTKSWDDGAVVSGFPAMEHSKFKRIVASLRRLPSLIGGVNKL